MSRVLMELSSPQTLGVLVLELLSVEKGDDEGTWDPLHSRLVLVFNARAQPCHTPWPQGALAPGYFSLSTSHVAFLRPIVNITLCVPPQQPPLVSRARGYGKGQPFRNMRRHARMSLRRCTQPGPASTHGGVIR